MHKHAGVTLDYFDDMGALLKSKFPRASDLPECIKTANVKPPEKTPDEAFALVALNGGHTLKKYACVDQGTTAMSVIYFMENHHKLPEVAVKTAASNLFEACTRYGLLPPEALSKLAGTPFLDQDRPEKVKEIYSALKREHPNMPAEMKARIAARQGKKGKQHQGPPYKGPLTKESQSGTAAADAATGQVNQTTSTMDAVSTPKGGGGDEGGGVLGSIKSFFGKQGAIDITGQSPKPKFAAAPAHDKDYAIVTAEGRRMYPIHDWDHIKQACDYWALEGRRMHPELRRGFAVKVASKAIELGYPLRDQTLLDAGAPGYADAEHVRASVEMRKLAMPGAHNRLHHEFLDELMDKTASLHPEVFSECVRRFDVMHGLEAGWDKILLSPWESTFGMRKVAEVVWESGADRVTKEELHNLARNHGGGLDDKFSDDFVRGFESDPVGVFESMPLPQKRILARLAADMSAQGGSVMSSYDDEDPTKSVGKRPATGLRV